MPTTVVTLIKPFNAPLLLEELLARGLPVTSVGFVGFEADDVTEDHMFPAAGDQTVGFTIDPATGQLTVPDVVGRGVIRVVTSVVLDEDQEQEVRAVISLHNYVHQNDDQKASDLDDTELPILQDDLDRFRDLTLPQKDEALRLIIRQVLQLATEEPVVA